MVVQAFTFHITAPTPRPFERFNVRTSDSPPPELARPNSHHTVHGLTSSFVPHPYMPPHNDTAMPEISGAQHLAGLQANRGDVGGVG